MTEGGRVGPLIIGHPVAREHFLSSGEVVTFRAGSEPRTTGDTHARWERTGRGMADVTLALIGHAHPERDGEMFREYAGRSGFGSADLWLDTIHESDGHGDVGELPEGHLYLATFTAAREPLKRWIRENGDGYGLTHCEGCGERVAPWVRADGGSVSGTDARGRPAGVSWCAWDPVADPGDRPDGWRVTLPENHGECSVIARRRVDDGDNTDG